MPVLLGLVEMCMLLSSVNDNTCIAKLYFKFKLQSNGKSKINQTRRNKFV